MLVRRAAAGILALTLALVACGDDDSGPTASTDNTGGETTASTDNTGGETTASTDNTGGETTASTATTAVPGPVGPPLLPGLELDEVLLTTPLSGEGLRPLLVWAPADSAIYYAVKLYAPDGSPYWAWQGTATQIHVGGEPALEDHAEGPFVVDGMTWGVIAYDEEWAPIAASERRPIGP
jgi:hypothetical protein